MIHFSVFGDVRQRGFNVFHGSDDDGFPAGLTDLTDNGLLQPGGLTGLRLDLKGDEPAMIAANDVWYAICPIWAAVLLPAEASVQRPQKCQNCLHNIRFTH